MLVDPAILPVITLVIGAGLSYGVSALTARANNKRDDAKDDRAEARRKNAAGRDHAAKALPIIRHAQKESWKRRPEQGAYELDLSDLNLAGAAEEIELIHDPVLRRRLMSVIEAVINPSTLASSAYSQGWPSESQRDGLYLLREALAAHVREEPTPAEPDALGRFAEANDHARRDYEDQVEAREEEEKERRNNA